MELDEFLNIDQLNKENPEPDEQEDIALMEEVARRNELNEGFIPYDPIPDEDIEKYEEAYNSMIKIIAEGYAERQIAEYKTAFENPSSLEQKIETYESYLGHPLDPNNRKEVEITIKYFSNDGKNEDELRDMLIKNMSNFQKAQNNLNFRTIAGLGIYSGALQDPKPIHVYDALSGSGDVSIVIKFIRNYLGLETTIECFDFALGKENIFKNLCSTLQMDANECVFEHTRIEKADLSRVQNKNTYCLARFTPGISTDALIKSLTEIARAEFPDSVAILPSRHGAERHLSSPSKNASDDEWGMLEFLAGTSRIEGTRMHTQLAARRILDSLRAKRIEEEIDGVEVEIRELVDHQNSPPGCNGIFVRAENKTPSARGFDKIKKFLSEIF